MSYSDEVCRNHHQGLPQYPSLHTWYYIIRTRSSEGMAEGCTWWALINGAFGYGSWSVACRAPWKDSSLLLQGGSIRIKNCTAELSCAKNTKIICLNSPGHCTHTNLLLYFWARIANCTSLSSIKFSTWNITGKEFKTILGEEMLGRQHFKICCTFNFTLSFYVSF